MKHKNVKVGQRVIIKRSTAPMWDTAASHIGEEFHVVGVEPLDYCAGETEGTATVQVESVNGEPPIVFWCNHRDLKLVKGEEAPKPAERPFKVGDKVWVIAARDVLFPVGTIWTVTRDAGAEAELPFRVAAEEDYWDYHESDLELYVEEISGRRVGQKFRVTGNQDKFHCFSEGDAVTLCIVRDTAAGHKYHRDSDGLEQWLLDAQAEPVAEADHAKPEDKAPEIGALFVVTGCTTPRHCFVVGTVVRCAEALNGAMGNCRYDNKGGARQFVSPSDLKPLSLADIQAALDK